ncbi:ribose-phosphate diphosphokinase [Phenylobacterium koreense]|uniref:ribose-phosphate diphosphokinase n=1 Tax=Phenylobacterium koreense TaxID=266125 RepID=A0ABV2ENM6_9CAUL
MRLVLPLPGNEVFAAELAQAGGWRLGSLETRRFPDGEHYVRLKDDPGGGVVDLVCSLARIDDVFLSLIFAADAAREFGAREVNLIAPYLGYMRQDKRFQPGEAVSSTSFARLVSGSFDRLITVDPHLHRFASLGELYPIETVVLHAAPLLGRWIRDCIVDPLVIGPDAESEQWAASVAAEAGAPHVVLRKERIGDSDVQMTLPDLRSYHGRRPVLIDDIASSGRTLATAARRLIAEGFPAPDCAVVHAIFGGDAFEQVTAVASRVISTDSVPHPSNALRLAPLIAAALAY